jgi:hypothetical protein
MTLLEAWLAVVSDWSDCFPQRRTFRHAVRQALGALVCQGRRCLWRIIWTNGGQHRSWSSEYFLHSRCPWELPFALVLRRALAYCPGRLVGVAVDHTRPRKTGRCIAQAFYQRDPLSPPFHVNLMLGLCYLQASLLVPLYRLGNRQTTAADLFRPLADRNQPPRREGHPGCWPSAVVEHRPPLQKPSPPLRSMSSLGEVAYQVLVLLSHVKFALPGGSGGFSNNELGVETVFGSFAALEPQHLVQRLKGRPSELFAGHAYRRQSWTC